MDKAQLRCRLRNGLLTLSPQQRQAKSLRACHRLIQTDAFQEASTVMLYLAMDHEADPTEAMQWAWDHGKTVLVPKVLWRERIMYPARIDGLDEPFDVGRAGLRNPVSDRQVPLGQIDLVVAPGLAFDLQGHRLGRGGGYYDRFFSDGTVRAQRCGFAFEEQVVAHVPVQAGDQAMDFLVTDEQTTLGLSGA